MQSRDLDSHNITKKKPCLTILLKVDISPKINFYYTILLVDYLQVKGSKKSLLDTKKIA